MMPGMKGLAKPGQVDDKALVRLEAIMSSMTAKAVSYTHLTLPTKA